jgi:hypothetical protein
MLSSFACKRTRKLSPAINWLVVFLPILKHMKVPGKDDIPYMKRKIKKMFQTTNQKQIEATNDFYRTMLVPPVTAMWQSRFVR